MNRPASGATPASDPIMPPGYALAAFDTLDSTMDEARRRAADGTPAPLWIWTRRQTAGRGRRGRVWRSGEGNLLCTLLLRPGRGAAEGALLSFVSAVALLDALTPFCAAVPISLKWPNDVLLNGRKVAGILLESESTPDGGLSWLAIGIGVNLAEHPDDAEIPATSLAGQGLAVPTPAAMLSAVAGHMAAWLGRWRAEGFAPVRAAWLARAARLGERIRVRIGAESLEGVFDGLDAEGCLMLDCADGRRRISAGDVFLPGQV
jgi:BirA family biotin operon repressor/biotin-[acetyl-CoA-carboxylase] ligase